MRSRRAAPRASTAGRRSPRRCRAPRTSGSFSERTSAISGGYAPAPARRRNDGMNAPLDAIAQHAQNNADGVAVVVDDSGGARPSITTWAELNATVNRLAHGLLAAGARP